MEVAIQKKVAGNSGSIQTLALSRKEANFLAVKELNEERGWPISRICQLVNVSTQGYYKRIERVLVLVSNLRQLFVETIIN